MEADHAIGDRHVFVTTTDQKKNESVGRSETLDKQQLDDAGSERERRDMTMALPSHAPPLGLCDMFLDFPVTINIRDTSATMADARIENGSVQSAVERNKCLCAAAGVNNSLTTEEEERVEALLREEDEDAEVYGFTHAKGEEREAQLDDLLRGLGYDVDPPNEDGNDETLSVSDIEPGEPVLCALAKKRALDEHERRVDRALFALLREPLVCIPEESVDAGEERSFLPPDGCSGDSCGGTTLSAAMTEAEMKELILQTREALEEDELRLADDVSVRRLAHSLLCRPRGARGKTLGEAVGDSDSGSVMLLLEREVHSCA